jgi:hypothetical protein
MLIFDMSWGIGILTDVTPALVTRRLPGSGWTSTSMALTRGKKATANCHPAPGAIKQESDL